MMPYRLSQSVAARVSCTHVPSTGARLARTHYLPNTTPPPTGPGENDLPFRGVGRRSSTRRCSMPLGMLREET
jgi:hypothetical protein